MYKLYTESSIELVLNYDKTRKFPVKCPKDLEFDAFFMATLSLEFGFYHP